MNDVEIKLKELIIEKYGSLKRFCEVIGMPWTTLNSILNRGIENSNITNVMKITKELGIDTESLAEGELVKKKEVFASQPTTIAAHFDGDEYTPEQLEKIKEYASFIKTTDK